jgi:hypothetical protein
MIKFQWNDTLHSTHKPATGGFESDLAYYQGTLQYLEKVRLLTGLRTGEEVFEYLKNTIGCKYIGDGCYEFVIETA